MSNNVTEILRGVVGELREIARSEAVIGEPVTVGDKTVIPVVKVSVGFGAGGGQGEDDKQRSGFGGGGGGGARIEPAAFIVIEKDDIRVLAAGKGKWEMIMDSIPELAKKFSKMAGKFKSDSDKGESRADDQTSDSDSADND